MKSRTLLERLIESAAQKKGGRDSARPMTGGETLRVSIARNLERVLNSRRDMAPACLDYGITDLIRVHHHDKAVDGELERLIQATIEQFEPRLARVRVRSRQESEPAMTYRFTVEARLAGPDDQDVLRFDATILSSGSATVS